MAQYTNKGKEMNVAVGYWKHDIDAPKITWKPKMEKSVLAQNKKQVESRSENQTTGLDKSNKERKLIHIGFYGRKKNERMSKCNGVFYLSIIKNFR